MAGIKFELLLNPAELLAALNEAKAAVAESTEQMKAKLEGVAGAFEGIQKAMIAVTAILAGGKVFSEAVQGAVAAATSAGKLGRELGITATQASILNTALSDNFVSSEAVEGAANKIATTLKKNENAFRELGVETRDANGNFKNSFDIMTDVNEKLGQFKEGTDRNVEGMKIYGKSWMEIAPTLRITSEAMEEAKMKATSLGLVVGVEGAANALAYRKSMEEVHTVFEAVEKVIGDALLPALTSLGQWFGEQGPQVIAATRAAIYSLYAGFSYLKEGVVIATDYIAGQVDDVGAHIMRFARAANAALHGDWAGTKAAWAAGTADIEAKSKFMADQIAADMKAATDARDKFFQGQDAIATPTAEKNGRASSGGDGKEKNRMAEFEAALAEKKAAWQSEQAAEGSFREFGKQQEIDYWQNILATTKTSASEKVAIQKQIAVDTMALQKQAFDGELARLKESEAGHKNNMAVRLQIEEQYAEKVKTAYGADSKEYAEAQKTIIETKRAAVEQLRQIDNIRTQAVRQQALSEIGIEEANAKDSLALHRITESQYLALERQFEAEKYALKQEALAQELRLLDPSEDPVAYATTMAKIEAEASAHNAAMVAITRQADAQQISLTNNLTSAMGRGFSTAFQGIINGTMTMGQAMKSVFSSIANTVISTLAQIGAKRLTEHAIEMSQGKEQQLQDAGGAATGAMKSAASIPYIGWAIAIGAAAAVFSAASGYSASGGFDVPSGINPMTQLHSKEMVLPAPLADRVRGMTANGDTNGSSDGAPVSVNFPGKKMGNMFMMHQDDLHEAITHLVRSGKMRG